MKADSRISIKDYRRLPLTGAERLDCADLSALFIRGQKRR
jgi:hypothetical protein